MTDFPVGFAEEFWSNFDRVSSPHGCWLWKGRLSSAGYGITFLGRNRKRVPRIAYELGVGELPATAMVQFTCRKLYASGDLTYRRCGRPSHLNPVTKSEHASDILEHERRIAANTLPPTKLKPWQVQAIRAGYRCGGVTLEALAITFGTTRQTIRKIVNGQTWRWLTADEESRSGGSIDFTSAFKDALTLSPSTRRVAKEAGVNDSYLRRISYGERVPSREIMISICLAMKLPPEEYNRLLMLAGYAPRSVQEAWGPALQSVVDALSDQLVDRERFNRTIVDLAAHWQRKILTSSLTDETHTDMMLTEPRRS